jgi:hypothetical protein
LDIPAAPWRRKSCFLSVVASGALKLMKSSAADRPCGVDCPAVRPAICAASARSPAVGAPRRTQIALRDNMRHKRLERFCPRAELSLGATGDAVAIACRTIERAMFFRRERPKTLTFSERMDGLRRAGFTVNSLSGGAVRVVRGDCAVELRDEDGSVIPASPSGILIGDEIGALVDGGFQKFFRTPSGKKKPATADELKALHDFDEDARESLGEKSYYNESLGTVSTFYLYDRVKNRDAGGYKRVWE